MYRILKLLALLWVIILCAGTLEYLTFKPDIDFLKLKQQAVATGWYLPAFYSHIFISSVILLAGFFQFSKRVYTQKKLHRALGTMYVFGVLIFAAPGAFVMTFFIGRGTGVFLSFMVQNMLWIVCTLLAFISIKQGNITKHVQMMRRSYALAFAAVTLRFYIWMLSILEVGVNFNNNYVTIALLSWIPNLIMVEAINYFEKRKLLNDHPSQTRLQ